MPLPDTLAACAEAFHELGWPIEKVEASRVVSRNGPASEDPATIEVKLSESDGGTSIRIIGTDSDSNPLDREELVAVLDQARDAIEGCLESAEEGAAEAVDSSDPDQEQEPEPNQPEAPEKAETAPAGWYPDHYDRSRVQYWDGEQWTQDYRPSEVSSERQAPESQPEADSGESRFRSLHVIAGIYGVLAWLVIILGGIAVVVIAVGAGSDNSDVNGGSVLVIALAVGFNALLLFGVSAAIRLALAVEENTRATVALLKRRGNED